jgi:hypothetical protein
MSRHMLIEGAASPPLHDKPAMYIRDRKDNSEPSRFRSASSKFPWDAAGSGGAPQEEKPFFGVVQGGCAVARQKDFRQVR